ncbi:hypothetical protein ABT187_40830 [Streptomyces sp. NPDC001817]|uniref:hypothetical protein n=1 Tax=Streptomyces sp. NPDC001817 TaxID=3154398 RepID=UPI0033240E74
MTREDEPVHPRLSAVLQLSMSGYDWPMDQEPSSRGGKPRNSRIMRRDPLTPCRMSAEQPIRQ